MTFQYRTFAKKLEEENKSAPAPDDLFYMKQTISNACGTVALIHAVANNRDKVKLDSGFLKAFLDASAGMTPQQRAEKLEKDDSICQVHDTVAKEGQTKVRRGKQHITLKLCTQYFTPFLPCCRPPAWAIALSTTSSPSWRMTARSTNWMEGRAGQSRMEASTGHSSR